MPELLDLPTGVSLGVGGVAFHTTRLRLDPGDQLVLYTDGLVESRDQPIDRRLGKLLDVLVGPQLSVERTCDLLGALREAERNDDDVALLIARARPSSAD